MLAMASANGKVRSFYIVIWQKMWDDVFDITIGLESVMRSLHVQCRCFCYVFSMYIIAKHLFDLS
jgi:hypothetical protein